MSVIVEGQLLNEVRRLDDCVGSLHAHVDGKSVIAWSVVVEAVDRGAGTKAWEQGKHTAKNAEKAKEEIGGVLEDAFERCAKRVRAAKGAA